MSVAAVVLRKQKINDRVREPGDTLTLDEYSAIPLHVRDAMENEMDIKAIFDEEAAKIFDALARRVEALEAKVYGE